MKGQVTKVGQSGQPQAPMQEVEFALILARMINAVKEDPAQMRIAVYEFARSKLKDEISWADAKERERLLAAFETAVVGVEDFSLRGDEKARLPGPARSGQTAIPKLAPASPGPKQPAALALPPGAFKSPPALTRQTKALMSTWFRLAAGLVLIGGVTAGALFVQRGSLLGGGAKVPGQAVSVPAVLKPAGEAQSATVSSSQPAPAPVAQPSMPLPTVYGVFAFNNGVLSELDLLSEQVPDKRVAMSTPVNRPSRIELPDGRVKFILYRRDLVANAPDRVDVRVVARVTRAMTFDAKGRGSFVPVSDAWNIRNVAYEFRVRPIPANPEMLLLQPENADFELPAGRYVLTLKNQGYDFSVAGKITDKAQCLERTDAANGSFYAQCEK